MATPRVVDLARKRRALDRRYGKLIQEYKEYFKALAHEGEEYLRELGRERAPDEEEDEFQEDMELARRCVRENWRELSDLRKWLLDRQALGANMQDDLSARRRELIEALTPEQLDALQATFAGLRWLGTEYTSWREL